MPIDIDSLPDRYSNESSPFDDVVAKDTQLLIDMVVENMPQQRQMIYRMSREQHLKNEEIALQLGIQKKTVENHLNLALKEIKKPYILYFTNPTLGVTNSIYVFKIKEYYYGYKNKGYHKVLYQAQRVRQVERKGVR